MTNRRTSLWAGSLCLLLCLGFALMLAGGARAQGYYNTTWGYRRPVTIDSTGSVNTLAGFTSKITLTSANWNFAHTKSDGSDIRACDTDGVTLLPLYLAAYNSSTQTGTLYVKKTLTAGASQTIYLYSGNAAAASVSSQSATMGDPILEPNSVALLHFDEGTGTTSADAKGVYTATLGGGATWDTDEFTASGHSLKTNGTGYATVPNLFSDITHGGSVSFWFKPSVTYPTFSVGDGRLIEKTLNENGSQQATVDVFDLYISDGNGHLILRTCASGSSTSITGSATFAAGTWHHVVVTWPANSGDTNNTRIYVDGALDASGAMGYPLQGNTRPFVVGAYDEGGTLKNIFRGGIDEVSITSGVYRPTDAALEAAHAQWNGNREETKWAKAAGNPVLTATASWEGYTGTAGTGAVQEPTVLWDGSQWVMYYTGSFSSEAMGRATSPDGLTWTKYSGNPVLGNGTGGESGHVACNNVYFEGGTYYAFYSSGPPFTSALHIATSSDGLNWTKQGTDALAIPSWATGVANSSLLKVGSTYHLMFEGHVGSIFKIGHATATGPLGPFTADANNALTTLQYGSGMFGGPWLLPVGGVYHLWHQYGLTGTTPTHIADDTSTDLITWTHGSNGAVVHLGDFAFEHDQVADPSVVEQGGKSFIWYSGVNNTASTSSIGLATYNGTLAQLITDGAPVTVGAETLAPTAALIFRHAPGSRAGSRSPL